MLYATYKTGTGTLMTDHGVFYTTWKHMQFRETLEIFNQWVQNHVLESKLPGAIVSMSKLSGFGISF